MKLRSLKQHLRVKHGLTPEEYRAKWGLPADYPMAAPGYAKVRSEFAKSMGLSGYRKGAKTKNQGQNLTPAATVFEFNASNGWFPPRPSVLVA